MKSIMTPQQQFSYVSKPNIQRSTFDRSHGYKTTFDAGKLIPFFVDQAFPGDTMKMSTTVFGRFASALIKPIMDNVALDIHYFSVPNRLVWENFKKFMGEQDNPSDSTDFLIPSIDMESGSFAEGSNYDYLGLPTGVTGLSDISCLPLRALHLIWNEWYRDENLQDSLVVDKGDTASLMSDYASLLPRGKRKDYFTSCLPFAQKGDPVVIPIGDTAPVNLVNEGVSQKFVERNNHSAALGGSNVEARSGDGFLQASGVGTLGVIDPNGTYETDLSAASAMTINALRESIAIQHLLERDARGGTRYTEIIYSHFNVQSLDQRLQRPEFLGSSTTMLNVNAIAQTADSGGNTVGNLGAMAIFQNSDRGFTKSFTEHEIVIGFISARADLNYQEGINRMWSYQTKYDFYWPEFANLGEQAVLNKEIYAQGTDADNDVFGYQERYAEMRYKPSVITGKFRSNSATSLDVYHLAQDFTSLPVLNDSFIQENPPIDRVIAVPSEPHFIVDMYIDLKHTRPLPVYSVPGLDTL